MLSQDQRLFTKLNLLLHWTWLLLAVFLLVVPAAQARDMRLGLLTPTGHIWTQAAELMAQDLAGQSEGRHSLRVYPARQLGDEAQMLQLMQTGALDMAIMTVAEISNRVPSMGAFYLPYLASDINQAARILRGDTARGLLDQLDEEIGVIGLAYGMAGMRQILSTVAVADLSDLQGRKLRITPFEPLKDFYRLAGVAPTPMPLSSVFDALANGQIDMLDMDLELILKLRYHELSDTLLISNHMMFPAVALISGRVWLRLSPADQIMIRQLTHTHMNWVLDEAIRLEAEWLRQARLLDITVREVGPSFFGDVPAEWEKIWALKAPALSTLRKDRDQ